MAVVVTFSSVLVVLSAVLLHSATAAASEDHTGNSQWSSPLLTFPVAPEESMRGADGTEVPLKGWVHPLPPADAGLYSPFCNVDRRPFLSKAQFENEYR